MQLRDPYKFLPGSQSQTKVVQPSDEFILNENAFNVVRLTLAAG